MIEHPEEFDFDDELDEDDEAWLAEWDEAEREAVDLLRRALASARGVPQPSPALADAAEAVRRRMHTGGHPIDWMVRAADFGDPSDLTDTELLIRLTAATISPEEETGLDIEEEATLVSLEMADWLGSIVGVVRAGPGADASIDALVDHIRTCPEVELETDIDADEESHLAAAFSIVALPWEVLGLIDRDERLTETGAWILPRALARAWGGDFDADPVDE